MGKIYRNKKGSGCKICKPYKHSLDPKFKHHELESRLSAEKTRRAALKGTLVDE